MGEISIGIGKAVIFYLLIVGVLSCGGETTMKNSIEVEACVIEKVLNHPDLKPYYHPNIEGRAPVKVLTNGLISNGIELSMFGDKVRFYEKEPESPFIEVHRFDLSEGEAEFEIGYEIEGVGVYGKAKVSGDECTILEFEVYES